MNVRGQNVIEYVLLLAAVMVLLILFLSPKAQFRKTLETSLFNGTIKQIENASRRIQF